MKIAIASEGREPNSPLSEMGARAPYYLIFDQGKLVEALENPFARGGGGAGFSVAFWLAEKGVEKIISKNFGGNMRQALEEKGMVAEETPAETAASVLE